MIRLKSLELFRFKNVEHGKIDFSELPSGGSITGIYGQNGSGKTAVVNALDCLRRLIAGHPQDRLSSDYLVNQSDNLEIIAQYTISYPVNDACGEAEVGYRVRLAKGEGNALRPMSETLTFKPENGSKRVLIDHTVVSPETKTAFEDGSIASWSYAPKGRWTSIKAFSSEVERYFTLGEGASQNANTSFIFSREFGRGLLEFARMSQDTETGEYKERIPAAVRDASAEVVTPLLIITSRLIDYSRKNMFVLPTAQSSAISFNLMYLSTVADDARLGLHSFMGFDTDAPCNVSIEQFDLLNKTATRINGVLSALIPDYSIQVKDLGPVVLEQGEEGRRIELMSKRSDKLIPFRCESEGIQNITGITSLLIDVYNNENFCLVIDELDSGVFEFLLGELLEVLSQKAKGQLIFTAHNLRALETLPSKCLVFTTSNPENRFVRFKGVKSSNNLRDLYLRAINLGGQDEEIYRPTDRFAIDSAFFRAGHQDERSFEELLESLGE